MEFIAFILLLLFSGVISHEKRCESVTIPLCKNIGYNYTSMPNKFHHANQKEAAYMLDQFLPLIETGCSEDLVFFLCSLYAPVCMEDYEHKLPPCFSVCTRVRNGCGSIMQQYGFDWPEPMKCRHFPKYGDPKHLCMDSKESNTNEKNDAVSKKITKPVRKRTSRKLINSKQSNKHHSYSYEPLAKHHPKQIAPPSATVPKCECECRISKYENSKELPECSIPCKNPFFNHDQQIFTTYWITVWAIICCIAASLTVLTFIIDGSRYCYPERPIVFLAGCYIMISIGYLLPFGLGHENVACDGQKAFNQNAKEAPSPSCAIDFLLIYFFTMASSLWWVILAFTWFLSAGLKWSSEAISKFSPYYHYIAWLFPTIKSIILLWIGAIDGDSISGICSVGNQNTFYLTWFVIVPLSCYSILGAIFLIAGFVSLVQIHSVVKKQSSTKTNKLEKLMIKICIFSFFYLIPAAVHIVCLIYEHYFKESWIQLYNCPCEKTKVEPRYFLFMLKYTTSLVLGIASICWITSRKTVESWYRIFSTQRPKPVDNIGSNRAETIPMHVLGNSVRVYTIS